jgi:hypothetical protein
MQQPKTEFVGALLVDGLGVAGEEVEIETKREYYAGLTDCGMVTGAVLPAIQRP